MVEANANPEKRLFISLITRDIGLTDAIVDLTDNSVNAAMRPLKNDFSSAEDFHRLFIKKATTPTVTIKVSFDDERVVVTDDASGIDFEDARDEVFRFGHSTDHASGRDRLSVYGIGMKRALFKIGNKVSITSDHARGGFSLDLNVANWAKDQRVPWTFPISKRTPKPMMTGTRIVIENLHDEIRRRVADGRFKEDLIEKLSKVYSFFLGRVIAITVNDTPVSATNFEIGSNYSHEKFKSNGVTCSITAGIAAATGDRFTAEAAGWFVFCNFRTVIYGDKTPLSGWGATLPLFQPKHRPFIGLVSFTSADPESLPWTTTKGSVNEDNIAWQEAKLRMVTLAKPVIKFLDSRYSNEGTDVEPTKVARVSGEKSNVFATAVSPRRIFTVSKEQPPKDVKVQYMAKRQELDKVRKHFSRSNMSASEIGRKTFDFFLRNEVSGE